MGVGAEGGARAGVRGMGCSVEVLSTAAKASSAFPALITHRCRILRKSINFGRKKTTPPKSHPKTSRNLFLGLFCTQKHVFEPL